MLEISFHIHTIRPEFKRLKPKIQPKSQNEPRLKANCMFKDAQLYTLFMTFPCLHTAKPPWKQKVNSPQHPKVSV